MHSPTDGHFFVYVLDIVSNAAMNMRVQVSSQISVFIVVGCIPRNGFAGLCGSSLFNFLRQLLSVFHGSCTNLHSHNRAQGFPLLHILASTCYSCMFDNSHSDRCEVLTCWGFDLHFPDVQHIFITCLLEDIQKTSLYLLFFFSIKFYLFPPPSPFHPNVCNNIRNLILPSSLPLFFFIYLLWKTSI